MRDAFRSRAALDGAFAALTFATGAQLLRLLAAHLVFTLRYAAGLSITEIGLAAAAVAVASALLCATLLLLAGARRTLLLLVAVMAAARLAEQLTISPTADLALTAIGVAAFLPIPALALAGGGAASAGAQWRLGLLLGVALDAAVNGAFGTLDPSWQTAWLPTAVGAALPLALLVLAARAALERGAPDAAESGGVLLAVGVGPLLALELLFFKNVALLTAMTGWAQPAVLAGVAAANVAALLAARTAMTRALPAGATLGAAAALAVAAGWLASAATGTEQVPALMVAAALLAAQLAVGTLVGAAPWRAPAPPWAAVLAGGAGSLALAGAVFGHYAPYGVEIAVSRPALAAGAALLAASAALAGLRRRASLAAPATATATAYAPLMAAAMLLAPAALALAWSEPPPPAPGGWPVRVMTYNIHQGFDTEGRLGMEALARAVEAESPDVVALQEVTRGWVVAGSVDTLLWLSQRLGMRYAYGPAADVAFGNAVLSRYPIVSAETRPMPNNADITMGRSYLDVVVDTGDGPLRVIATHLHHLTSEGERRAPQVTELVARWNGAARTVIVGDLNAQPGWPELAPLEGSAMVDAYVASGSEGQPYTARSHNLHARIDYIWASPDLRASGYSARVVLASDHLPVAADVAPR